MWKSFVAEEDIYMLKLDENDTYNIYLTDFTKIWSCRLSKEQIVKNFQDCNPAIEINIEECFAYALKIINEIERGDVLVTLVNSTIELKIKISLPNSKFKMKYELELTQAEDELFTNVVTVPLVQTVILLEKQQKMMKALLEKKDRELEEYQMEKGEITRTDLITEKFEPDVLISSSSRLMLGVFEKCVDHIERKYGATEETVKKVETETWNSVKRKRKIYNKETAEKKKAAKIVYQNKAS